MYQADFVCTYKLMDNEYDQEQLYRIQLLQAFDLNVWEDDKINSTIAELYAELLNRNVFNEIFLKARQNTCIIEMIDALTLSGEERLDENDIIFKLLFKFEYFDLLHRCLVDYLLNKTIDDKYINNLMGAL
jgi:hypothetical protein